MIEVNADVKAVAEYCLTHESGESARNFVIFAHADMAAAGVTVPAVPMKWDATWQMRFPDWDALTPDAQAAVREYSDFVAAMSGLSYFYRGAGRAFGDEPSVRIGKRFTVVSQRTGLDV